METRLVGMVVGPTVTRYELELGDRCQGGPAHQPAQGHRLRDGVARRAHPGPDPRPSGHRRRGAQQGPSDRRPGRHPHLRGGPPRHPPARGRRGPRHLRHVGPDEPGDHAPPAHRRSDRRGQVVVHQLDHHVDPDALHPRTGAHDPDRPQGGRAVHLQRDSAPDDPGGHQPEEGRAGSQVDRDGDGPPVRRARRGRRAATSPGSTTSSTGATCPTQWARSASSSACPTSC